MISSRTLSTPVLDAASSSYTSGCSPAAISLHCSHVPSGRCPGPCSHIRAFARMRAMVVLPVPRGPQNRYAWLVRPSSTAFSSVETTCCWPTTWSNVCGRYFLYRDSIAPPARRGATPPAMPPRHRVAGLVVWGISIAAGGLATHRSRGAGCLAATDRADRLPRFSPHAAAILLRRATSAVLIFHLSLCIYGVCPVESILLVYHAIPIEVHSQSNINFCYNYPPLLHMAAFSDSCSSAQEPRAVESSHPRWQCRGHTWTGGLRHEAHGRTFGCPAHHASPQGSARRPAQPSPRRAPGS